MELPLGTREEELTSWISIRQSTAFTPFLSQWRAARLGGVSCKPAFLQTVKKKKTNSITAQPSPKITRQANSCWHTTIPSFHATSPKPSFTQAAIPISHRPSFQRCQAPSLLSGAGRENPHEGILENPTFPLQPCPDRAGVSRGGEPGAGGDQQRRSPAPEGGPAVRGSYLGSAGPAGSGRGGGSPTWAAGWAAAEAGSERRAAGSPAEPPAGVRAPRRARRGGRRDRPRAAPAPPGAPAPLRSAPPRSVFARPPAGLREECEGSGSRTSAEPPHRPWCAPQRPLPAGTAAVPPPSAPQGVVFW